ncbi:hypothetical protein VPH35_047336 [Triticum aestivum]
MDDPQVILGVSRSQVCARMERNGMDRDMVEYGYNLMLYCVYAYIRTRPSPLPPPSRYPASPTASTASVASPKGSSATSSPASPPRTPRAPPHLLPDGDASGPFIIGAPSPRGVQRPRGAPRAFSLRPPHLQHHGRAPRRDGVLALLDTLIAKGVQELVFGNRPWPIDLRLPATLFSCASLTRLCLGVFRLPDTAAVPRGARFPNLRELNLCLNTMEERDLAFLLERSPVLGFLFIMGNQAGRCVQLGFSFSEDIDVVDAPRLERLFQFGELAHSHRMDNTTQPRIKNSASRIKIGRECKIWGLATLLWW